MESNKDRKLWWRDPVINIREKLRDLQNKDRIIPSDLERPAEEIRKSFNNSKVRSNGKCQK